MSKVFCGECRHYWESDFGTKACNAKSSASGDWYEEFRTYANPQSQNKNNDCSHWQHKRGFIEWLGNLMLPIRK